MKESSARLSAAEPQADPGRVWAAAEELVGRLWKDAGALARQGTAGVSGALRADGRRQAARVLRSLETRGQRVRAVLEEPTTWLTSTVRQYLDLGSRDEVAALRRRITGLEQRLDALAREDAEHALRAAAGITQ